MCKKDQSNLNGHALDKSSLSQLICLKCLNDSISYQVALLASWGARVHTGLYFLIRQLSPIQSSACIITAFQTQLCSCVHHLLGGITYLIISGIVSVVWYCRALQVIYCSFNAQQWDFKRIGGKAMVDAALGTHWMLGLLYIRMGGGCWKNDEICSSEV